MATYAIGDVQGCYTELRALLHLIDFNAQQDTLWFTGDLVNRGPQSLTTLRFIRSLGANARAVLGNHDIHLLAVARGHTPARRDDTFQEILNAPDREALLTWLRHLPLLHHDPQLGYTLVHAGLPPQWDLVTAQRCAQEVERVLQSTQVDDFLIHLYGDGPDLWSEDLTGYERLRFITNALTRLRYCDAQGRSALRVKGPPGTQPEGYRPWFEWPERASRPLNIVFGHWSTLGACAAPGIQALDTGCVWGGALTALCLENGTRYTLPCLAHTVPE